MPTKRKVSSEAQPQLQLATPPAPPFADLLRAPLVEEPLPLDFKITEEAEHLSELWAQLPSLHNYTFERFVHAGGSGMVFQVKRISSGTVQALKIARHKLLIRAQLPQGAATSLSPVSERELRALEKLSHPNVVRLYEAFADSSHRVLAIATTYVEKPQSLDGYLRSTLARVPRGGHAFSPARLDGACAFLLERCEEIAAAVVHMHNEGIYHFDIKPANVLISAKRTAVLTDLGACVHSDEIKGGENVRVQFTWTYAHPDLTTMINKPESISGGGLKASAELAAGDKFAKYDLYAFGRMLQEALAILEGEFGERAHAAYGFRYLHLIASLLMDGKNAPSAEARVVVRDGRRFVSDAALDYPARLFAEHKIETAADLLDRLKRYSRQYSWHARIPELDPWQPNIVNTGVGEPAPFTKRVAAILGHPVVRRLKSEAQLGWIKEVFPGATHNRWSHTIGVFAALVRYYNSLLADPENPTFRVLVDPDDLLHAMLAALLHDIGQVSFGHDLEAACPHLYNHEEVVKRLLEETNWGPDTLIEVIAKHWPLIKRDRVLGILRKRQPARPIDGVAQDILNGPIDADKLDYLQRDSVGCGVAYGRGIDTLRFLQALSTNAKSDAMGCKVVLAYKAKGAAAIEAVLLARYQMYGAVYWHHTFRCIQAMFSHAAAVTFEPLRNGRRKLRETVVNAELVSDLLYQWVVCGKTLQGTRDALRDKQLPKEFTIDAPPELEGERALEFVWKFADDKTRKLLERLGQRDLYKRVYEVKVADLGERGDYSALKNELEVERRPKLARDIEDALIRAIYKSMTERGPRESVAEDTARQRYQLLAKHGEDRIVIDFPTRGVPDEDNVPPELGDPARKYTAGGSNNQSRGKSFHVVRQLQTHSATLRVFAAEELHELVVRYLDPPTVEACVNEVIPRVRVQR